MNEGERDISIAIANQCKVLCESLHSWMLDYCAYENKTHRFNVLMDFVRRCHCNLYAIFTLYMVCMKFNKSPVFFKLPVGILIRTCLTDCLYAFYIGSKSEEEAEKEIEVMNKDYVKSLLSRETIFKERLSEADIELDSDLEKTFFRASIEDTFPQYHNVLIDEAEQLVLFQLKSNTDIRGDESPKNDIKIGAFLSQLYGIERYSSVAERLNAYYKYFSQYEHFSEQGHGDSLAPYEKDNVSFPLAIKALEDALNIIHEDVTIRN